MSRASSEKTSGSKIGNLMHCRTLILLAVCGIVAFLVLGLKLYQVMIIKHDLYESAAVEQQLKETTVAPSRGAIYDCEGKILAMSAPVYTVYFSPVEIVKYDLDKNPAAAHEMAAEVSDVLGLDYDAVFEKTQNSGSWYEVVQRKVEDEQADKIREFKNEKGYVGLKLEKDSKRYYPYDELASHVIGFVGTENYGLSGIESEYNKELSGETGRIVRIKSAAGDDLLFMGGEDYHDARDGYTLTTTIDATIQYYLEKHLKQAAKDLEMRDGAAAICMDVNTGKILGMVSLDNYDLNNYQEISEEKRAYIEKNAQTEPMAAQMIAEAQLKQWRNKALSDTYEPGSVFKIITLAMALNEGVVNEDSNFYCGGSFLSAGDTEPRKCWRTEGHGMQTLTQAVQHSCNIAFIQIGQLVGAEKFYDYAEGFGFLTQSSDPDAPLSAVTGIDLAGESGSIWWSRNEFTDPRNLSQLAAASFGQTFTITPLQLITAVSACVNGGYLMQPYVVEEITDSDGSVISAREPKVVRQVISGETSREVCSILEKVVSDPVEGTGKNAYVAGYRIGGKTGTSEKTVRNLLTGEKEYIVSFLGFAPADNPEIAILVLLDNPDPETGVYVSGGQMAAPVVAEMMSDILPYMGIEAQYTESEYRNLDRSMPNIKGLSVEDAQRGLEKAGFTSRIIGDGTEVTDQLPAAGVQIAAGSQVIIYAGAEPSQDLEEMIDLKDLTYSIARQRLGYLGLFISADGSVADAEKQMITAQNIKPGEKVEHGTVVSVTLVSGGSAMLGRY